MRKPIFNKRNVLLFYSKNFSISYFATAKNASTTLRPWLYSLDDLPYEQENALHGPRTTGIPISEYRLRFSDYFLFTCVRNPYTRLVSCYLDKFVYSRYKNGKLNNHKGSEVGAFQSNLSAFKKVEDLAVEKFGVSLESGLSFEQFLRAISPAWPASKGKGGSLPCDPHWASQFDLAALSELGYDAVIKCENLFQEMELLQEHLGIPAKKKLRRSRRNVTRKLTRQKDNAGEYLGNIPAAELSRTGAAKTADDRDFYSGETSDLVANLYRKDLAVFDYHSPLQ